MNPARSRREFLGLAFSTVGASFCQAREVGVLDRRPQPWERRREPVLSAAKTYESWCKVVLYSPHVLFMNGKFKMWYIGSSSGTEALDMALGYAESDDGFNWREYPHNPILTGDHIPWGSMIQTPCILFDRDSNLYKMWFVAVKGFDPLTSMLSYATSPDGIAWKVHPKPLYKSARRPSVLKEGPTQYRMWMNSAPNPQEELGMYQTIYEFRSSDGVNWTRSRQPVIHSESAPMSIYPFVLKEKSIYWMWFGSYTTGRRYELFCAKSKDGTVWETDFTTPAFHASEDRDRFDSRYVATPCVLSLPDRYWLYYSTRDWRTTYIDGSGQQRTDRAGIYGAIGAATIPR